MRNAALEELDGLVGQWTTTLSGAWFLDPGTEVSGTTTIAWIGESFLEMRYSFGGEHRSETRFVFGRSDANDRFVALHHDDRGVCRVFDLTFGGGRWTMVREDPDFHQRFVADVVTGDRVEGRWEASEDEGRTWRTDFDLLSTRR